MVQPTKFYTACIRNEVHQGFVADNVLLAGKAIGAMGNILENLGYLLTQFGWTGVVLSGAGLGAGTVWEAEKVQKLLASLVSEEPHSRTS